MNSSHKTRVRVSFIGIILAVGCAKTEVKENKCLLSGLPDQCCDAGGWIRPEILALSRCSTNVSPADQQLAKDCKYPSLVGEGPRGGAVFGAGQSLGSIVSNTGIARTYNSDQGGVKPDTSGATSGGNGNGGVTDPNFKPGGGAGSGLDEALRFGRGGSGNGGIGSGGAGSGSGSNGLTGGGGGTTQRAMLDPNTELDGKQVDSGAANSAYGGGGSGGSRSGGGSGSNSFGNPFAGLFGAAGSGGANGAGAGGSGIVKFGAQGAGAGGAASGSADPEDYFTRIGIEDSLFKKVEKRYEQTALKGAL